LHHPRIVVRADLLDGPFPARRIVDAELLERLS
jgi:hypothetical protein